jgi:threonine/homoserine/homoserine lactone efflux protein
MAEALSVAAIRWGSIPPLLLMSLAVMGSPGPATISLVAVGSVFGVRHSLKYLIGVIVGTTVVLVAVASGITAALLALPAIGSVVLGISAAYILWLAYHVATAAPLSAQTAAVDAPSFAGGALLGVTNPKGWVAIAAAFTSAHLADDAATDAAAKIAVLTVMLIVTLATWLVAGRSLAPVLREPRRARLVNAALAVGLVGAAALAITH